MQITRDHLPVRVPKPWGYELWWAWTDDYVGKLIYVARGHKLSLQYHVHKDETCFLERGRLLLHKGEAPERLTATPIAEGAHWRNRPGELHTIEALDDSYVWEVSTPQVEDVVRVQDDYGRAGTSRP